MGSSKIITPIRIFSYVLIGSGLIGIYMAINLLNDPNYDDTFSVFISILTVWHLLTGFGIVIQRKWGFILLKLYLFVLFLGFPIGTLIAKKLLDYIKFNNIEVLFR